MRLSSQAFGLEAEIRAKVFRKRFYVKEVPISYDRKTSAEGKNSDSKMEFFQLWHAYATVYLIK